MRRELSFLICAAWGALVGQTLLGAPTDSPPARPSDSDWDVYKKVNVAIADPKQKPDKIFSEQEVKAWLLVQNWLDDGKQHFEFGRFRSRYNDPPYHLRDLKRFKEQPWSKWAQATGPAAETSPNTGLFAGPKDSPWQGIKLRQSYSEVLAIEDPTQDAAKKVETLQGALFSYTKNFLTEGDSWSFQGALLFPFVWQLSKRLNSEAGLTPLPEDKQEQTASVDSTHWAILSYGAIPSVSIYRVTGVENIPNTTLKNDVDQLTFRVGLFEKLSVPSQIFESMTLRGFATYVTDTGFESSIPSGQLEWEPQVFFTKYVTVGYATNLLSKQPMPNSKGELDSSDTSYLAYQFRFRAHADYGTVINSTTGLKTGAFFRVGPITEFRLDPLIFKNVSASVSYQYLPAIAGSNDHNSLFTAGGEWKIANNPKTKQSLSLKITYTEGGLEISKQQVRTLIAGLGGTW